MIFDLHNDILTYITDLDKRAEVLESFSCRECILAYFTTRVNSLPKINDLPKSPGFHFAVEDMGFYNDADEDRLLSLNPLYCSLTWNYDNSMAGGAFGNNGLTADGEKTVSMLNKNGIAVDGAHLNEKSFFEVSDAAERFFVSHTCVKEKKEHKRNVTLEQIKVIANRGSIVGLTPINEFTGDSTLDAFVEAVDFVVQAVGDKVPAIGTDFFGSEDFPQWLRGYESFALLEAELKKLGYTDDSIQNIFYNNAKRFFSMQ